jgi:hypothetical protein
MVRGANVVEMEKSADADLEPYYRLVEMQKQMIDLIQRNAHTERECAALREQLAREVEALARSRRSLPDRLRHSASGLLKRFLGRNGNAKARQAAPSPFSVGWSQPFEVRGAPAAPERSNLTS